MLTHIVRKGTYADIRAYVRTFEKFALTCKNMNTSMNTFKKVHKCTWVNERVNF